MKRAWSQTDIDLLAFPCHEPSASQLCNDRAYDTPSLRSATAIGRGGLKRPLQIRVASSKHPDWTDGSSTVFFTPKDPCRGRSSTSKRGPAMVAPRPAYRPLSLGRPASDDEGDDEALSLPRRAMSQSSALQNLPSKTQKGPERSCPRQCTSAPRLSFTDFGPPLTPYDPLVHHLIWLPSTPRRQESPALAFMSRIRRTKSAPEIRTSSLDFLSSTLQSASSPSADDKFSAVEPIRRPVDGRRRTSWLRRQAHKLTGDLEEPGRSEAREEEIPEVNVAVVPLHSQCSCKQCSGRIAAGLTPGYVPHWSKLARAKWLADRRHAEIVVAQSEGNGSLRNTQPITLTGGPPPLLSRNVDSQTYARTRSPPPHGPSQAVFKEANLGHATPTHPESTAALLEMTAKRDQRGSTAVYPDIVAEAGEDLQRILSGRNDSHEAHAPSVQVDEVDQKYDNVECSAGIGLSATHLEAVAYPLEYRDELRDSPSQFSSKAQCLRSEHNGTPIGVSEEESMPMDDELKRRVDEDLDARAQRPRTDQMIKRRGARAMMAQLEEADRQEQKANERRLARKHSGVSVEGRDAMDCAVNFPPRPMGAYSSPQTEPFQLAPARSQSPIVQMRRRTSSPLLDRLRAVLPSSSHHSDAASAEMTRPTSPHSRLPSLPRPQTQQHFSAPVLRTPSPLSTSTTPSVVLSMRASTGRVPMSRTPSPFVPASSSIPEEDLPLERKEIQRDEGKSMAETATRTPEKASPIPAKFERTTLLRPSTLTMPSGLTVAQTPHLPRTSFAVSGAKALARFDGSKQEHADRGGQGSDARGHLGTKQSSDAPLTADVTDSGLRRSRTLPSDQSSTRNPTSSHAAGPAGTTSTIGTRPSSASPSPSTSVGEDAQRRLKRRSLQRRFSAPLKGLFKL